jgi:hypothetical protein
MNVRSRLMSVSKFGNAVLGAALIPIGAAIVRGADRYIEAALVAASLAWLTEFNLADDRGVPVQVRLSNSAEIDRLSGRHNTLGNLDKAFRGRR